MRRTLVSGGWVLLSLAALSALSVNGARARDYNHPHAEGIPGIGPATGVDVYIPNPDPQTPIAWSQGTEPPPPQGDYGGGALQYMITGNELRPAPHPGIAPPYFPARFAPLRGPDGRTVWSTHARPFARPAGAAPVGPAAAPPPAHAAALAYPAVPPPYRARPVGGFGFGASRAFAPVGPGRGYAPAPAYGPGPQARVDDPPAAYAAAAEEAAAPGPDPAFRRQEVVYRGGQAPGTVVIDTADKFLYLVEDGGQALRYGIGVGKPGFLWSGTHTITRKAEWPDWTPPAEMLGRRPDLPRHMDGGIENPLGARAMYLGSTLYRIHGTNEPNTIGTNVSSGCIRLTNDDVTDLYGRVGVGTRVVVM